MNTHLLLALGAAGLGFGFKLLLAHLKALALHDVLVIVEAFEEKLFLAARNLPHVQVATVAALDPVTLARHEKVLVTVGALKMLEEKLA